MFVFLSMRRTHNERTIFVLIINGMIVRAYSDPTEANNAKQKVVMTRPTDQPIVTATTLYDHQTIDSVGSFGRINADWT
jgi:ornithine cyclodeaminase/alanine dehydrogenase-like protein (mu-crystallin family)